MLSFFLVLDNDGNQNPAKRYNYRMYEKNLSRNDSDDKKLAASSENQPTSMLDNSQLRSILSKSFAFVT